MVSATTNAGTSVRIGSTVDTGLVAAIQDGLPLTARPFARIAEQVHSTEAAVIADIRELAQAGIIKRFGVVVRHRALGFTANAMVVWDISDDLVDDIGERMAADAAVTLCYRRPRRPPAWPYNLFCIIHGRDRDSVIERVECLATSLQLSDVAREVLFSRRQYKQRGAHYVSAVSPLASSNGSEEP